MFGRELLAQFIAHLLQLHGFLVDVNDGGKHALGFHRQIDRSPALAIAVERGFGVIDLGFQHRQLRFKKLERVGGFGGTDFDVLTHIAIENIVEYQTKLGSIFALQRGFQNTGLFCTFLDREVLPQIADGILIQNPGQLEAGTRPGSKLRDKQGDVLRRHGLTDHAIKQFFTFLIEQLETAVLSRYQSHWYAEQAIRYFQRFDLDLFSAPGVIGHAKQGFGETCIRMAACDCLADDRHIVGSGLNIQFELIDNPSKNHS